MITYEWTPKKGYRVMLEGRLAGWIKQYKGGWRYEPAGSSRAGVTYNSVEQVKRSIEGAAEKLP